MQVLVFHIGDDGYGLATGEIARVLPLLQCKRIPGTPDWVAGVANIHEQSVPVIDLSQLALGVPAAACRDTRIVLVHYTVATPHASTSRLLGLLAERVSGVIRVDEDTLLDAGITAPPWLGKVASKQGMLQLVDVAHLLPDDVRALLYPEQTQC